MKQETASRNVNIKWALLAVFVLLAGGVAAWFFTKIKRVPEYNILLVTFDTTRADRIGCYGADDVRTPAIDTLAKNGITYQRCIAPSPVTQPSHATLMTGLYPFRHGIRDNAIGSLSENAVTLAEILKKSGYLTGAAVGAFVLDSKFGIDQGFDTYDDQGMQEPGVKFGFAERNAEAVTDVALNWLDQNQDSKFFYWAHYFDPHADYAPPGIKREALMTTAGGMRKLYDLEISYTDNQMARLLNKIKKIQDKTNRPTLVIMTSDHGESLQNHGEPSHGFFVYQDTLRVPLVVYDSLNKQRGIKIEQTVSLADVMPTVLHRLQLKLPYEIDGKQLPKSDESADAQRPVYFETIVPFTNYGWSPLEGVTIGDKKFISAPKPEFYNLTDDPRELKNLYQVDSAEIEEFAYSLDDIKEATLNHPDLTAEEVALKPIEVRKLMSLGYLASLSDTEKAAEQLADPKDKIHIHRLQLAANNLLGQGMARRAFKVIEPILQEEPDNRQAFENLISAATQFSNQLPADQVIPLLRRGMEKHPEVNVAVALGMMYEQVGDDAAALTAFNKGVELDDSDLAALNNSAYYLYKLGSDLEVAQQRSERVVKLIDDREELKGTPTAGRARHTLACILMKRGNTNEAIEYLQVATKLVPDYAAAFYQLGIARQTLGENQMAAKLIRHAIDLSKNATPDWLPDAKSRLSEIDQ